MDNQSPIQEIPQTVGTPVPTPTPSHNKWLLSMGMLLIFLLSGTGMYVLGKNSAHEQVNQQIPQSTTYSLSPTPSIAAAAQPTITTMPTPDPIVDWKTYIGQYVTFKYPPLWHPIAGQPVGSGGVILEDVNLGIPGAGPDMSLGFSEVNVQQSKPTDVIQETTISISGKIGYKWLRKGNNYVSYDYYTSGRNNHGSFGIHVTESTESKTTEASLDMLIRTIQFK